MNQSARASYETLAELAGLNIIFDRDFQNSFFPPFRVEKADILEAFDRLSAVTGNFVEVFDSNTLLVAPNNAVKRQKYETQVVKTIYLTSANSEQDAARIVTALRTLNIRFLAMGGDMKAIVIKDTPDRSALPWLSISLIVRFCSISGTLNSERNFSSDSLEARVFTARGSPPKFGVKATSNSPGFISDFFTSRVPCCFRSSISSAPRIRKTEESVTSPL